MEEDETALKKTRRERVKKIFNFLESSSEDKGDLDQIYIAKPDNDASFSYFSCLPGKNIFYSSLIISRDSVKALVPDIEKNLFNDSGLDCFFYRSSEEKRDILKRCMGKSPNIGINYKKLSYLAGRILEQDFSRKRLKDVSEEIYSVRASKDETEIDNIQKACDIASKVSRKIPGLVKQGMTELQLKRDIDNLLFEHGSVKPSFDTLVGFGKNSALPHPPVGPKKLRKGDIVLVDFGATHRSGYVSDISRSFVCGSSSFMQRKMYWGVLDSKAYAEKLLTSSKTLLEIQQKTSKILESFPGELTHGVGHSLGLEVHDGRAFGQPFLIPENYATTIEPGLYNPAVGGIRIEDDYLVQKNRLKKLTKKALPSEKFIEL